jgi:hypothetical protein
LDITGLWNNLLLFRSWSCVYVSPTCIHIYTSIYYFL